MKASFSPYPTPQCLYGTGVKVIKTKKVTTKRYSTYAKHGGGSYLNLSLIHI